MQRRQVPREETTREDANAAARRLFDEWRTNVSVRLDALSTQVQQLLTSIEAMRAAMPTRAEIERGLDARVDKDTYTVAHAALIERIARLEASPQKMLVWVSVAFSGCSTLLYFASLLSGLAFWVLTHR